MGTNENVKTRVSAAKNLEDIHHLSDNRLLDKKFSDEPPWTKLKLAMIKTSLLDPSVNKSIQMAKPSKEKRLLDLEDTRSPQIIVSLSSIMYLKLFVPNSKQRYQL